MLPTVIILLLTRTIKNDIKEAISVEPFFAEYLDSGLMKYIWYISKMFKGQYALNHNI